MEQKTQQKPIRCMRYITEYESVDAANADKKRLGIFDAELNLSGESLKGIAGGIGGLIPSHIRTKLIRKRIKLGISWKTLKIDGKVNFVFIPCGALAGALNAMNGMGWLRLYLATKKEFTKLKCPVFPVFVYEDELEKLGINA